MPSVWSLQEVKANRVSSTHACEAKPGCTLTLRIEVLTTPALNRFLVLDGNTVLEVHTDVFEALDVLSHSGEAFRVSREVLQRAPIPLKLCLPEYPMGVKGPMHPVICRFLEGEAHRLPDEVNWEWVFHQDETLDQTYPVEFPDTLRLLPWFVGGKEARIRRMSFRHPLVEFMRGDGPLMQSEEQALLEQHQQVFRWGQPRLSEEKEQRLREHLLHDKTPLPVGVVLPVFLPVVLAEGYTRSFVCLKDPDLVRLVSRDEGIQDFVGPALKDRAVQRLRRLALQAGSWVMSDHLQKHWPEVHVPARPDHRMERLRSLQDPSDHLQGLFAAHDKNLKKPPAP